MFRFPKIVRPTGLTGTVVTARPSSALPDEGSAADVYGAAARCKEGGGPGRMEVGPPSLLLARGPHGHVTHFCGWVRRLLVRGHGQTERGILPPKGQAPLPLSTVVVPLLCSHVAAVNRTELQRQMSTTTTLAGNASWAARPGSCNTGRTVPSWWAPAVGAVVISVANEPLLPMACPTP